MPKPLNKLALLEKLEHIRYEKEREQEEEPIGEMSLTGALLTLASIDHEREYELCHAVAEHLLGVVPEPAEVEEEE